jgi:hypothetical protein
MGSQDARRRNPTAWEHVGPDSVPVARGRAMDPYKTKHADRNRSQRLRSSVID